jgi:2-iminobutanoate/2-iminopropanoate deaminase
LSGIVGIDPKTNQLAGSTIQEQTRQALINCENILRAAEAGLRHVVDILVLLSRPIRRPAPSRSWVLRFQICWYR